MEDHYCTRCWSTFGIKRTATYFAPGVLVKYVYACTEHAVEMSRKYNFEPIESKENEDVSNG